MVKKLNVALSGAGFMGKAHSLAWAAMPMFFWPAPAIPVRRLICDVTDEIAADAALRFGFERSAGNWRAAIEDPEIDIVDVATPNNMHAEIAIAAAQAGKHVICEKPLARDAEEAKRMLDAVKQAGVTNMVTFNYRRTPAIQQAKKLIEAGELGDILKCRVQYLQDWSADPSTPLSWRFSKSAAGSGSLGDIGTHALDLARFLVGEIIAVNAVMQTYIKQRPKQQGGQDKLGTVKLTDAPRAAVDVDDEAMSLLRFENGAVGSLEATRNAYGRNNYLTAEIHGTKGSISFNYERMNELEVFFAGDRADTRGFRTIYTGPAHPYGEGMWPIPGLGIGYNELKIIECYDFCKAVVEGSQASPSFRDGYQIARITDAIIESNEKQAWVEVPALGA